MDQFKCLAWEVNIMLDYLTKDDKYKVGQIFVKMLAKLYFEEYYGCSFISSRCPCLPVHQKKKKKKREDKF